MDYRQSPCAYHTLDSHICAHISYIVLSSARFSQFARPFLDNEDYCRVFDVAKKVEFMDDCVPATIEIIIHSEVTYLTSFVEFKKYIDDEFEMPDKMVPSLVRFLEQAQGTS